MTFASTIPLFRAAEDYFFRAISYEYLEIGCEAIAYKTNIPVADLNLLYIHKSPLCIKQLLEQGQSFYAQQNLPFTVIIPEIILTPIHTEIFKNQNYISLSESTCMAIKLANFTTDTPLKENLTILAAKNLTDWNLPLIGAFESTSELTSLYKARHQQALIRGTNLQHFCVYHEEAPISSISLSIHNQAARIDDVGTLPKFQKQGYATQLINYALSEAQKMGAEYCFLESSDMGSSMYQKIGFRSLFQNHIYAALSSKSTF